MIQSPVLLIVGLGFLTLALFSYSHHLLRKLGGVSLLITTYAALAYTTGSPSIGVAGALLWFFLPWFELLTRVRNLRIPLEKKLRRKSPPDEESFPNLEDISQEIEADGFHFVQDSGWDFENHSQFYRIYYHAKEQVQATICMNEEDDMAFYYVAISSRRKDGTVLITWNYPFTYGMQLIPKISVNRIKSDVPFHYLMESHRQYLVETGTDIDVTKDLSPEEMEEFLLQDMREQIEHNLKNGIFTRVDEKNIRYTWKGLFFLWSQFLLDLVRL